MRFITIKRKVKNTWYTILIAIFIGIANGFFGGGGGMLAVPLFEKIFKFPTKVSHASAIFVILPISIASIITYITQKSFDFSNGYFISAGVIIGGILGAILLKKLNNVWIQVIFSIIMIIAGVRMCF
jgi:uncharacterized protein